MAVIFGDILTGKRCWACGKELNEVAITFHSMAEKVYIHPNCGRLISQQLIRDVSELIDLGYAGEGDSED